VVHRETRVLRPVPELRREHFDFDEARELLRLVEIGRPTMWTSSLCVLVLLAVVLLAAGVAWAAGLTVGVAVSLSLHRNGPHWWPGRR
jgi:hypothetical protein